MLYREFAIWWGVCTVQDLELYIKYILPYTVPFKLVGSSLQNLPLMSVYRSHCCVQVVNDHVITVSA